MTYDLIVVTQSRDKNLIAMTQRCIDSCKSEGDVHVILVESGPETKYNKVDIYVKYEGDFNYNRALNMGLKHRKSDIQILANNDLIFRRDWSVVGHLMRRNGYLSASLPDTRLHKSYKRGYLAYEGWKIGVHFTGWCLFADKQVWDIIGDLSEVHNFWFSDNVYAEQLQAAGIKHALITCATVDHIESATLKKQDKITINRFVNGEIEKYAKNKRLHGINTEDLQTTV